MGWKTCPAPRARSSAFCLLAWPGERGAEALGISMNACMHGRARAPTAHCKSTRAASLLPLRTAWCRTVCLLPSRTVPGHPCRSISATTPSHDEQGGADKPGPATGAGEAIESIAEGVSTMAGSLAEGVSESSLSTGSWPLLSSAWALGGSGVRFSGLLPAATCMGQQPAAFVSVRDAPPAKKIETRTS